MIYIYQHTYISNAVVKSNNQESYQTGEAMEERRELPLVSAVRHLCLVRHLFYPLDTHILAVVKSINEKSLKRTTRHF